MNSHWVSYLPSFLRIRLDGKHNLQRILNNTGWLFFDKILRMGVGALVGVWIARYLGPEQFGQINYAMAFVGLFGAIAVLGLDSIVVRDIVRKLDGVNTTLGTAFVLQLFGSLMAIILITVTITWLRPDDLITKMVVAIISATLFFKSTEVIKYWFESQVQSRYTVWVENIAFVITTGIKVSLVLLQASLIAFVWVILAEAVMISIGLLFIYERQGGRISAWLPQVSRAKSLLKDSWPLLLSNIAIIVYMRIDQVMLGEMLGAKSVGFYSAANRISEIWYFIPVSIASSVFPAIISSKAINQEIYLDRIQKLYDFMSLISISVSVVVTLCSKQIISILYGAAYIEASPILSIQIWSGVFVAMGVARGKWLLSENLQHVGYWYVGISMIVNVIGNFILIPSYGGLGASVATLLAQATTSLGAPALFRSTRISVAMLIKSLNPARWFLLISLFFKK